MLLEFRIVGIVESPAAGHGLAFTDTITTYDLSRVDEHAVQCKCSSLGSDREFVGHLARECVSASALLISLSFGLVLFALFVNWFFGVRFPLAVTLSFLFVLTGFAALAGARRLMELDLHEQQVIDEAERLWRDRGRYRVVREEEWNSFLSRLEPYRAPDMRRARITWPAYRSNPRRFQL